MADKRTRSWWSALVLGPLTAMYAIATNKVSDIIPMPGQGWWVYAILVVFVLLMIVIAGIELNRRRSNRTGTFYSSYSSAEQIATEIVQLEQLSEDIRYLGPDHPVTAAVRNSVVEARQQRALMLARNAQHADMNSQHDGIANSDLDQWALRSLGVIALALPFVLLAGDSLVTQTFVVRESIGGYYFTAMRDILVGSLCAMGILLLRAVANRSRALSGAVAGIAAIVTALFPPAAPGSVPSIIAPIRTASTALLIILSAYFVFSFINTIDPERSAMPQQRVHNRIYLWCGLAILASVVITILLIFLRPATYNVGLIFWLESIWLVAFGVACLLRGTTTSSASITIAEISSKRNEESGAGVAARPTSGGDGGPQHEVAADGAEPKTQTKPPDPSQDPTKPGRH